MTSFRQCVVVLVLGLVVGPMLSEAATVAPSTACQQTWLLTNGFNAPGGALQGSVSTLAECQAACIAISTCNSLDFNPNGPTGQRCWTNTALNASTPFPGISHYDLTRPPANCGCVQTWLLTNGWNAPGGALQGSVSTLAECQAACIANPTCNSLDFAPNGPTGQRCWTNTALNASTPFPGISHYDLTRPSAASCAAVTTTVAAGTVAGTCVTYTYYANVSVPTPPGTLNPANTVADCQAACTASSTCQSIDFTPGNGAGNRCYLSTNGSVTTNQYIGNDHYIINRNAQCAAVTTTVAAGTAAVGTCIVYTYYANVSVPTPPGTLNPANTAADCQAACTASSTCQSIDFTPGNPLGNRCYLSTNGSVTTNQYIGNDHYIINRNAPCAPTTTIAPSATTTAAASCAPTYTYYANVSVPTPPGTLNPANTVADCQAACTASSTCQSIDFTPGNALGNRCYLSTNGTVTTNQFIGNDHYIINRNPTCAPTTTIAPSCIATYTYYANVSVPTPPGTLNPANTVADCQAACTASSTCQSIDFTPGNALGNRCYLSTNGSVTTNQFIGNDHYIINRPPANCNSTVPNTCSIWYVKSGGVVTIDPSTSRLLVSNTNVLAACFNINPCVASSLSGFNATSSCISLSPYNTAGTFARFDWFNLLLQPQSSQAFPIRFSQDASFILGAAMSPGYSSLQPVFANSNGAYYFAVQPDNSVVPLPAAALSPPPMSDMASFAFVNVPQPNTQNTATCSNVWTRINEAAGNRTLNVGNATKVTCRQRCLVTPYCIAVSFDWVTTVCYLEIRQPNAPATSLTLAIGFTYFELNPAYPGSCLTGDTFVFTGPTSTVLVNATTSVSAITYWQCRLNCTRVPSCIGINYDSGNCTLVTSLTGGSTNVTLANFQKYTYGNEFTGPCNSWHVATFGFNDPTAVLQNGITNQADCFTACTNNPQCTGYDSYNSQCYFSLAATLAILPVRPTLNASPNAFHGDLIRRACGAGCRDKWDTYFETTASNLTLAATAQTDRDCRQLCQSVPACTLVNWNYQTNTCQWGTAASVNNFPGTSPGWRLFVLSRLRYCDDDY